MYYYYIIECMLLCIQSQLYYIISCNNITIITVCPFYNENMSYWKSYIRWVGRALYFYMSLCPAYRSSILFIRNMKTVKIYIFHRNLILTENYRLPGDSNRHNFQVPIVLRNVCLAFNWGVSPPAPSDRHPLTALARPLMDGTGTV